MKGTASDCVRPVRYVSHTCLFEVAAPPHPAEDGHQVVLTHGEHVDVFDYDQLVVVLVEDGVVHHICHNKKKKQQREKRCTDWRKRFSPAHQE